MATNVCALPVGMLLDKYGPRISGLIGSVLIAIGAILLAFAVQLPFDGYISGYIFLALGGPFVFISLFQLSNTFPNHSGLILALLTGAFDSSSAIFLFYRLAYKASNQKISLQKFFLAYLSVPIFIFFVQIFLMPSKSYKTIGELTTSLDGARSKSTHQDQSNGGGDHVDQSQSHQKSLVSEVTSLLERSGGDTQEEQEDHKKATSGVWGALHGLSALQQIRTPWFALMAIFTIVQITRINYFVATIRTQYVYMLHSNVLAEHVNNFFDVALPLGGVVSIPFIGLILDNTSTPFVLALLVATATAIGIFGVLPFTWAAYANIAIFVIYRPFYYTAISDYAAKVFGFHTFGKVYGLSICLAGLFNFSQSALDAATHQTFHSNPTPVNVIMIVISLVVGLVLFSYVWHKSKLMVRGSLEDEAEDATETVVPWTNRNEHY